MSSLEERAKFISQSVWGYSPTRPVKPVHFANGFFRSLTQETKNPALMHKTLGGFRSGKSRTTTEQLIQDLRKYAILSVGDDIEEAELHQRVNLLRSALDLVFNQDRAVFPSDANYSMTLSHRKLTSSDTSDNRTGRFMASVLIDAEDARAVNRLRIALDSDSDNSFLLAAPLLKINKDAMGPLPLLNEETRRIVDQSLLLKNVQKAFNCLSEYEPHLEKTMFLQRVVTLGSFALFLHTINGAVDDPTHVTPLLLCGSPVNLAMRNASRATFVRAKQRSYEAFEDGVRELLSQRNELNLSAPQYREAIMNGAWQPEAEVDRAAFLEAFEQEQLTTSDVAEAFVRAAVHPCFQQLGKDPTDFLSFLGRLSGLLFPRVGGKGEKYLLPTPQFLDMLVAVTLEPGETCALEDFWKRVQQQFGLISGARSFVDADLLYKRGIRHTTIPQLEENAAKLRIELQRLGYARLYSDDVALIQSGVQL